MSLAPIVLFVYNRPDHTFKTLRSLMDNDLASQSELFIYCEGPKKNISEKEEKDIQEVRRVIKSEKWCNKINIIEAEKNRGLAKSIVHGVSEVIRKFGKVIVLEDDMITSKYFLRFMNEALDLYESDEKVVSITGYLFPVKTKMPETFFLKGTYCWGWATWKRGWDLFSDNSTELLRQLEEKKLTHEFDFYGTHHYTRMLKDQVEGKSDSWALPWYAAAFLKDKLTLLPGISLIQNIGLDASGTHGDKSNEWSVVLADNPIHVNKIIVEEVENNRKAISIYFKSLLKKNSLIRRIKNKLLTLTKK